MNKDLTLEGQALMNDLIEKGAKVSSTKQGVLYVEYNSVVVAKKCTKCLTMKLLEGFMKDKRGFYQVQSICKNCQNKKQRERYETEPDKVKAYVSKWKTNNPDKVKDYSSKHYSENKEKIRVQRQIKNKGDL